MKVDFRRTRLIVLAVCVVFPVILWAVNDLEPRAADYSATVVSVLVAVMAIFVPQLPSFRQVALADWLDQALSELAAALEEQWREEGAVRGIEPVLMPARFRLVSDPALTSAAGAPDGDLVPAEGAFAQIAEAFRTAGSGGRLMVLGAAGAGKSALALRLTLELLRGRTGTDPVPVLLPVASWNPAEAMEDWVAARLCEQYPALSLTVPEVRGPRRSTARVLIGRLRILPILDGLDEMAPPNRASAIHQLSAAVGRGQPLLVTCRSRDYREILAGPDGEPVARTQVAELEPLSPADVRAYLLRVTMAPASRWNRVFAELQSDPPGVVSEVLSMPLMAWLAGMVYHRAETDPDDLIKLSTRAERLREHLLDGLIPAAYAEPTPASGYPARTGKALEPVHHALTGMAAYLRDRKSEDFAWWKAHEEVPALRLGATAGAAAGCVLGPAVGLAVSVRAGTAAGVAAGLGDAIVAGMLCGITVMIPKAVPRLLDFRLGLRQLGFRPAGGLAAGVAVGVTFGWACSRGGGPAAAIVVFTVVTSVSAVAVGTVFGAVAGMTGGVSAGLSFGLAAGLAARHSPVTAGLVTGSVFTLMGWIWTGLYQPTPATRAVSPQSLFSNDRTSSLIVGLTSGIAYGVAYAFALGPWIGALATCVLAFAVTITVSSWGQFTLACLWHPLGRGTPLHTMRTLREAHERGVLRQSGMYYQFRHTILQDRLANVHTGSGDPPSA